MKITKIASAGTLESSDAYVEIGPATDGIQMTVESVVAQQFGEDIRATALDVLQAQGVENANVRIVDRGALSCVLRARVETAIHRGKGEA